MPLDVLSHALRSVGRTGVVFFDFALTPPWAAEARPSTVTGRTAGLPHRRSEP